MTVQNIGSESWCRRAYLNYHCHGNTMGLTAKDMGQITQAWENKLSSWQASASTDETEYDFDDSEYANYKDNGKEAGEKVAGGDEGELQETGKTAGLGAGLTVNLVSRAIDVVRLAKGGTVHKVMGWVAAAAEAALAAAYWIMRPNKDAKEACDELKGEMTAAQETLTSTQGEMETYIGEIEELSDLAYSYNEDTNKELEEQKTEYDMYYETMLNIQAKIDAGEPLTESEKELYKSVIGYLQEIGLNIEELSEDTTDEITALYEEIGTYQDGYDTAAQTMGEIEGLTDFAGSFDKDARAQAYILGTLLGLNAGVSGALATMLFCDPNVFTKAVSAVFACTAAAAAISNGFASAEQFRWAGDIGAEIELREATQDLNSETMDVYDENIDYYDGYMQGIEDLELEIPDDIEVPEEVTIPTGSTTQPSEEEPVKKKAPEITTNGSNETT